MHDRYKTMIMGDQLTIPSQTPPANESAGQFSERAFDLDNSVSYNYVLVPGAFHSRSHWRPLGRLLHAAGHNVIYVDLQSQNPNATFEDDTNAVKKAIGNHSNLVLMTHSRGTETLRVTNDPDISLERYVAVVAISSGGPHAFQLDPNCPEANLDRYTAEYRRALTRLPNNMVSIDKAAGKDFFYHDVADEAVAQRSADNLQDQRDSRSDPTPPYSLPTEGLAVTALLGKEDRILTVPRAIKVWQDWAGVSPELLPAGHTPQLSITNLLAKYSIHLANQARKR